MAAMESQQPILDRITIDPAVCHGKPVIRGTRVLVQVILGCLAGGDSVEEIASEFQITPEDVRAAVAYAESLIAREQHFPLQRAG